MITLDGANKQLVGSALFMEQKVVCTRYQSIKTSRDDKTVHLSRLLELGTAGLLQAAVGCCRRRPDSRVCRSVMENTAAVSALQLTPASDNDFITGPRLWSAHAPGLCLGATMLGKW